MPNPFILNCECKNFLRAVISSKYHPIRYTIEIGSKKNNGKGKGRTLNTKRIGHWESEKNSSNIGLGITWHTIAEMLTIISIKTFANNIPKKGENL